LARGSGFRIEAEATTSGDAVQVTPRRIALDPVEALPAELASSVLRYVIRTREAVLLEDAARAGPFAGDEYIRAKHSRSILCLPLLKGSELVAILYLENDLTPRAFTPDRFAILRLLASQAAIALENARLFADLRRTEGYLAEAQRLSHTGSFGCRVSSSGITGSDEPYEIFAQDPALAPTLERVFERIHPEDAARVRTFLERTAAAGGPWELEHRLLMRDGSVKEVHVVAHGVREESGDVVY